jgi:LysM repeat protein
MQRHRKALARLLAVLALAATVVALVVVISDSLGDGNPNSNRPRVGRHGQHGNGKQGPGGKPRKFYVVQSGDTLSSIASKTGVSVNRLERLNPDVDPQILLSGEKLKLR